MKASKWLDRENFQDLAKNGRRYFKKTVATGEMLLKKKKISRKSFELLNKGKEEILKRSE